MYTLWEAKSDGAVLLENVWASDAPGKERRRGMDQEKDGPAAAAVAAEIAQDSEIDEDTDFVCMMANEGISPQSASSNRRSTVWHIDSARNVTT